MEPISELTVDTLLTSTRNVRKRLDFERQVDRKVVEGCLELALQAPNGGNHQTWEWLAVDDLAVRVRIAELYRESFDGFLKEIRSAPPEAKQWSDASRNTRWNENLGAARYLAENLHRVPIIMVPTIRGRPEGMSTFWQANLWGSILPAAWSFMLALRSRGLGSCFTTAHLRNEGAMAEVLGIPDSEYTQAGLLPVAYTLGTTFKRAQRRPPGDVTHWNQW